MNTILKKLQTAYSFSDHETALIKYGLEAFLYDASKCLLMLFYFHLLHKTWEYLIALLLLLLLRRNTGGLHLKSYTGCLLFTFIFMNTAIIILPRLISIGKWEMCLILLSCIIIDLQIGPVHTKFIKHPNHLLVRRSRLQASYILFSFFIISFLLPASEFITIGFWIILLQTLQLVIAKRKEVLFYGNQLKK